jgi:hypothetical protein
VTTDGHVLAAAMLPDDDAAMIAIAVTIMVTDIQLNLSDLIGRRSRGSRRNHGGTCKKNRSSGSSQQKLFHK